MHPVPVKHGGEVDGSHRWLSGTRQCQQQPERQLGLA
jgi:hypothetical protein